MITASAVPLGAPRGLFVVAARAVHTNKKKCGKLAIFVQTKAHWSKANTNAARSHIILDETPPQKPINYGVPFGNNLPRRFDCANLCHSCVRALSLV